MTGMTAEEELEALAYGLMDYDADRYPALHKPDERAYWLPHYRDVARKYLVPRLLEEKP